jgi:hypothetical protein
MAGYYSSTMKRRILVKGGSGAGKTTLGLAIAQQLNLPFVELDSLHHGPNWAAASAAELQARVRKTLDDDHGWVVDGNYDGKLGTMLFERAQLIVWLDLPLRIKLWRLAKRTARRWWRKEELWNGNRETLKGVLWGRDGLFPWAVCSHFRHRRVWIERLRGRPLVRLRTAGEVDAWFADFSTRSISPPKVASQLLNASD